MKRLLLVVLMFGAAAPAFGQPAPVAKTPLLAVGDFSVERTAGFSWFSPGGSLGDVTHRRVYLTGIRGNWLEAVAGRFAFAYTMELVPLAVVERTAPNSQTCYFRPTGVRVCRLDRSERVAVGAGGSPIGGRLYLNRAGRWRAHVGGAAGALVFSSDVPIYGSRQFNFTFDYGGAVELTTSKGRDIAIGYKFHHISNAGTGEFNPGLDANVIYVGVTKRRARQ